MTDEEGAAVMREVILMREKMAVVGPMFDLLLQATADPPLRCSPKESMDASFNRSGARDALKAYVPAMSLGTLEEFKEHWEKLLKEATP